SISGSPAIANKLVFSSSFVFCRGVWIPSRPCCTLTCGKIVRRAAHQFGVLRSYIVLFCTVSTEVIQFDGALPFSCAHIFADRLPLAKPHGLFALALHKLPIEECTRLLLRGATAQHRPERNAVDADRSRGTACF